MLFLRDAAGFILRNLFEVTVVSVAWLVLQLPILTGPGATVAVYQFARQAVLQDEARLSDFWRGLRLYLFRGWLIVAPLALVLLILGYDILFFLSGDSPLARVWASVPIAILSALLVTQSYVLVLYVQDNRGVWATIRRAYLLAMSNLLFTMTLLLVTLLYFLGLYVTRIGLALLFVGPVALLQTKAAQLLLNRKGIEF
ncbi:MAG: hypothetical protein BWY10_00272 [Chloroflexi bacterium ADurb.Bin180]|jgi:uncharacterized membrane protein YesL|nr:MAG: hypothetical protein BWY10_00272 [Chloroflexi bacterium ADurb.Bin180]HNR96929.1 hypothetical protein [Anaerolineae bacterium]HNT06604.1 hypothetical protein [Anaerolineae bacterium]